MVVVVVVVAVVVGMESLFGIKRRRVLLRMHYYLHQAMISCVAMLPSFVQLRRIVGVGVGVADADADAGGRVGRVDAVSLARVLPLVVVCFHQMGQWVELEHRL